jgi:hypothetical protein
MDTNVVSEFSKRRQVIITLSCLTTTSRRARTRQCCYVGKNTIKAFHWAIW